MGGLNDDARKFNSIAELPDGTAVGDHNDPSNDNRARLLLQSIGLVMFKARTVKNNTASPLDVVDNSKKLKLVRLYAAQLPSPLNELTTVTINNDFSGKAGLSLAKDAIVKEVPRGPYANIIAVRCATRTSPESGCW